MTHQEGRFKINGDFLKINGLYLRIGPAASDSVDLFIHNTTAPGSFSHTGTNPQDGDRVAIIAITESVSSGVPTTQTPGGDLAWTQIDMSELSFVSAGGNASLLTAWWAVVSASDPASPLVTYAASANSAVIFMQGLSIRGADPASPIIQYDTDIEDTTVDFVWNLPGFLSSSFGVVYGTAGFGTSPGASDVTDFTQLEANFGMFYSLGGSPPANTNPIDAHINGPHGLGTHHGGWAVEVKHV